MHPVLVITGITLILVLLPAVWRLLDDPIDWGRWSLPHRAARAIRTARARRRTRTPDTNHQHVWHTFATCKCGAVHTFREPTTP